jgi:hypothetical protein
MITISYTQSGPGRYCRDTGDDMIFLACIFLPANPILMHLASVGELKNFTANRLKS